MKFKEIIKSRKLTQTQIARQLNVSQSLISQWTKGKCEPQLDTAKKLAEILNCSIEEVVNCFEK